MKKRENLQANYDIGKEIFKTVSEQFENGEALLLHYNKLKNKNRLNKVEKEFINKVQYTCKIFEHSKPSSNILGEDALQFYLFERFRNVPFPAPAEFRFTFIDLFAGVGGFRLAMQNLGGKCVFSSEWDQYAKKTYEENFGEIPFGDITKDSTKSFIPKQFDVLCAGFPCQAFSIAGQRKGFADTRGTLFFDIEAIIQKHRPKVVFLENVKNLVSHDNGKTFKVIKEILTEKLGYKVFHKVLNTMEYANIPQNRERIIIVAFDPNAVSNWVYFEFPEKIKLDLKIRDIIDKDRKEAKYYYGQDHLYFPELSKTVISKETVYQWRRVYARENKNYACPTLTANMGTGGHNVPIIKDNFGIRKLTPRECFSFQGYPMNFILPEIANSKLYMQAGNTVTQPLIERVGRKIIELL